MWGWVLLMSMVLLQPGGAVDGPHIRILGTAQDAGLPQIGCQGTYCQAARTNPERRRLAASLLIVQPEGRKRWLIDVTPDIREQAAQLEGHAGGPNLAGRRPPLFSGIFLTHAHMGHYGGLLHLGREAYHHPEIPVYASQRMTRYLASNGPWSLLVENKNIRLETLVPGEKRAIDPAITVEPLPVPHREEFSDTFGYIVRGPRQAVLYIPDIDKWERWERKIEAVIAEVDVALLDGSFFADGEIPGVPMSRIPHPFIAETVERLSNLPLKERNKVIFTHLNHTNPAASPGSSAHKKVLEAGMSVADDGQIIAL